MHELTLLNAKFEPVIKSNLSELKKLSKQLIETESTLSAFWHLSPALKCIAKNGRFIKVNPAWTRVLGYTAEELLSTDYKEFVHPDDIDPTMNIETTLAENNYIFSFRNRYKHKFEDRWVVIEWTASQEGEFVFASGADKTIEVEQELKVKALLEEAAILRNAIDHSNNGIVITDPTLESNPVVYVNSTFEGITGYSRNEVIGSPCYILAQESLSLDDLTEKSKLKTAIQNEVPYKGYIRNTKKDGSCFINQLKVSPVFGENGKLCNYIASVSNCTDEYQQVDIMKTVLTNAPFGIFLTNGDGHCIYVNKKWQEIAGLNFEEAQGRGWTAALCDELKDEVSTAWYEYAEKVKKDNSLSFNIESCFHNRRTGKVTRVKIHAYFYKFDTTIGYIDIQPLNE